MNSTAPIRKAVFPVAGMGTRFLPATKAVPKELLPIVDKPLIQYAVEEAIEAGVDTLVFVNSPDKPSIPAHFEAAPGMESVLASKGKHELLQKLQSILPDSVSVQVVMQEEPLGLGHAVLCAASVVGNEPFAVVLPDDMVFNPGNGALRQLVDLHDSTGASILGVERVALEDTRKYGVVDVDENESGHLCVHTIVEKPEPEDAPSNLGVIGRYLLTPDVFEHLRRIGAGVGGEIQLTDAIAAMLGGSDVLACAFEGKRYDCGSRRGFLKATVDYALAEDALRDDLLSHLDKQVRKYRE